MMRWRIMPLLAAAFVTASIAGLPRTCAEGPTRTSAAEPANDSAACSERYNALLGQAKASLIQGDRNAAINSLIAANSQLRRCEELEKQNSTARVGVAMNNLRTTCLE